MLSVGRLGAYRLIPFLRWGVSNRGSGKLGFFGSPCSEILVCGESGSILFLISDHGELEHPPATQGVGGGDGSGNARRCTLSYVSL